ncbi:hypothetical protein M1D88_01430 [Arthrobacter sp. R1-13]
MASRTVSVTIRTYARQSRMRAAPVNPVLQLVLADNRGDCMSLGLFAHHVSSLSGCPDGPELREEVIGQLVTALKTGLLSVGDMIGTDHFPWPDTPAQIIAWIGAVWPDDTLPSSFERLQNICWLANTPAGDQAAGVSPKLPPHELASKDEVPA